MNNVPSRNPADDDSLPGTLRLVLRKYSLSHDDFLPVRVIAHSRSTNRVQVEHLIQQVTTGEELVDRGQIASVPVMRFGDNNFMISFRIAPGSLGWIKAADRDISLFLRGYSKSPPNDGRVHDFSSGVFMPDAQTGFTIAGDDSDAMVIQNTDSSTKISLSNSRVKIRSGGVDALTITGSSATFGVPIIDSNGVNHDTHGHEQPSDSDGNSQFKTSGPS